MGPSAAVELNPRRPLTAINNKGKDHEFKRPLALGGVGGGLLMYPQVVMVMFFSPGSADKVDVKEEPMQRLGKCYPFCRLDVFFNTR